MHDGTAHTTPPLHIISKPVNAAGDEPPLSTAAANNNNTTDFVTVLRVYGADKAKANQVGVSRKMTCYW